MRDQSPAEKLLIWYDTHARILPWRIPPDQSKQGVLPDPYRVWLSEVMLQQTTVAAVKEYFQKFTTRWPTVHDMANAADEDVMAAWAGLGYYARARNLLKCARMVSRDFNGAFPTTPKELLKLPGIGPYTASAIASIAFGKRAVVVDGNVERVIARCFNIHTPLPAAKPELTELADKLTPKERPGDYAQAVMDLGATICTPKNPACSLCPIVENCLAKKAGSAAELPKKKAKKPKPTRFGIAYIAKREDGALLLEKRPEKGLLGGMLGWPGTAWSEDQPIHNPPLDANWQILENEARHTFTHFHLRLRVKTATVPIGHNPRVGTYILPEDFIRTALPTVMRKAFDLTQRHE